MTLDGVENPDEGEEPQASTEKPRWRERSLGGGGGALTKDGRLDGGEEQELGALMTCDFSDSSSSSPVFSLPCSPHDCTND